MKLLGTARHLPSLSDYDVGELTSEDDRNRARSLLYRKYVSESKHPWKIPPDNPSGIRVEERLIDGEKHKCLVDDFDDVSIIGGIKDRKTGKLLMTVRILLRKDMPDQRLEIERYESFPFQQVLVDRNCKVEGNRLAAENEFRGKRCGFMLYYALIRDAGEAAGSSYVCTVPARLASHVPFASWTFLGSFKYHKDDPTEVCVSCGSTNLIVPLTSLAYSATRGSIFLPAGDRSSGGGGEQPRATPALVKA